MQTRLMLVLPVLVALVLLAGAAPAAASDPSAPSFSPSPLPLGLPFTELSPSPGASVYGFAGVSVAIDGDTALVGSPWRYPEVDAAFVYRRQNGIWSQEATLTAPGGVPGDTFGFAVALEGDTAVVGAPDVALDYGIPGAAYVFRRVSGSWSAVATLTADVPEDLDGFGHSVALRGDTVLVGAPGLRDHGAAFVFRATGAGWTREATLTASRPTEQFGFSVALDGDTALIGAPLFNSDPTPARGAAYVFTRAGTTWTERTALTARTGVERGIYGYDVALDGGTALVGECGYWSGLDGAAYAYEGAGGVWRLRSTLSPSGRDETFAYSVALDGGLALVGAPHHSTPGRVTDGAAYVYSRWGAKWEPRGLVVPQSADADAEVALSVGLCGADVIVGAPGQSAGRGAAFVGALTATIIPSVTGGGGRIGPSYPLTVPWGAQPRFTFTPQAGYRVQRVVIDGGHTIYDVTSYHFPPVCEDHTIAVEFVRKGL